MSIIVFYTFFTPINSTNVYIFIFFQEQGHRNDLISKGGSPVTQDDRNLNSTKKMWSLLSTPDISENIKFDSVHCDTLPCVASGSRCHTADDLNETKDVDAMYRVLCCTATPSPPPPGFMCSPSPVQTPPSAHSVQLWLLLMLIVQLYSSLSSPCEKKA